MPFDFEISEPPPVVPREKRYKYYDLFTEAKKFCKTAPGKSVRVMTFETPSSATRMAQDINNGDNQMFRDDFNDWTAVSGAHQNKFGVWLTYNGEQ